MLAKQPQLPVRRQAAAFRPAQRGSLRVQCIAQPKRATTVSAPSAEAQTSGQEPVSLLLRGALLAAPLLLPADQAAAKDGAFGLLEGTSAALVHPLGMGIFFVATLYAGYLGWQWRRTRTIGEEIKELKKTLPAPGEDGTRPPSEAGKKVEALEKERKELLAGNYKDKHWNVGSVLLAGGVGLAVEGCVNTFMRTERLFPGPHLYAGATIVALWAAAAALVPAMQKGDDNARNAHIALNVANVALFVWQVPTGLQIVEKVFQFTSWP